MLTDKVSLFLVQDYVAMNSSFVTEGRDSLNFLLAQSYLTTGEVEKSIKCFLAAASYPGMNM